VPGSHALVGKRTSQVRRSIYLTRPAAKTRQVRPLLPPLPAPGRSHGPTFPVSFDEPNVVPIEVLAGPIIRVADFEGSKLRDGLMLDYADCVPHAAAARLATFATVARLQPVMS
jgi:hypothetical protein